MHDLLSAALAYAARGMAVFPLAVGAKTPLISRQVGGHGALDATTDAAQIRAWWTAAPRANIGIAAGASGLLLVDVDNKNGRDGFAAWEALRAEHPFEDATPHVWTPNRGKHLYFAMPSGLDLRNTDDELGPGIETKANGKYCVAPPSELRDGGVYRWDERLNLDSVPIAPVPQALWGLLKPRERVDHPASRPAPPSATTGDLAMVQDALRWLDPWAGPYDWWVSILMAIHSEHPGPDGLAVAEAWGDGKEKEIETKWRSFRRSGVTIGTLYHEAEKHGWLPPWRTRHNGVTSVSTYHPLPEPPDWPDFVPTDEPASLTDDALAERIHDTAPVPQPSAKPVPGIYRAVQAWAPRPAREFVVDGLLWRGDLAVLYGEGGIGKTYAMVDMAVAVAMAEPWLDLPVTPGKTLLVDEESGQNRILDRLERTMRGHGIAPGTDVPIFATSFASWDLRAKGDARRLCGLVTETQAQLVIIDALVDVMLGGDENAVKDVQPIFHNLRLVAQTTGAAIVVMHHANKGGNQRGSSAIRGAVETVLCLSRQDSEGHVLRLEAEKMRDSAPIKVGLRMAFDGLTESFRLHKTDVSSAVEKYSKAEKFIIHYLRDHGATSVTVLQENADICSAESARRAVYSLADRQVIRKVSTRGRGVSASYDLADGVSEDV
jgi:hypothetical protein